MNPLFSVLFLYLSLVLCALNVYAMNSYRISVKRPFLLFAIMTAVCGSVNTYLRLSLGQAVFAEIMIFTIAVPYFILFLLVSRDRVSQIFFNFWLWVTVYAALSNVSILISDLTFQNLYFENALRISLLCAYFVLYTKVLKPYHRKIMETPNVNWWAFSMIPLFFEILIIVTLRVARVPEGFSRNHIILAVIFALMALVYGLVVYIFRKANALAKYELTEAAYRQQLDAAKTQISVMNEVQTQAAIYRHDMRHNLTTIDAFLSTEHVQQARDYIKEVQGGIDALALQHFCENDLVNLLCSSFSDKAKRTGIRLTADTHLPEELSVSDTELCAILSNGFENAFHAVSELDSSRRWIKFYSSIRQENLLIEITNPYQGEVTIRDGLPVSSRDGHGYGCLSIQSIAAHRKGICTFDAKQGVFTLRVVLPVHHP